MRVKIAEMNDKHVVSITNKLNDYDDFWNENILREEFLNNNSKYFVILDENNILGFGGLWFNIDEAHIMNIAIKKDFRRKHLGETLLEHLIKVARMCQKKCITLEVREDNLPAISLYKKMNFEDVGRRKKYYNSEYDAIIMTKKF